MGDKRKSRRALQTRAVLRNSAKYKHSQGVGHVQVDCQQMSHPQDLDEAPA